MKVKKTTTYFENATMGSGECVSVEIVDIDYVPDDWSNDYMSETFEIVSDNEFVSEFTKALKATSQEIKAMSKKELKKALKEHTTPVGKFIDWYGSLESD